MQRKALYAFIAAFIACLPIVPPSARATGQFTSFTYQGQLNASGSLANGTYQFTFTLYDAATNGNVIGAPIMQSIAVVDGLFTTPLDFGAVFTGQQYWLDIQVGTTTLNEQPLFARQPVNAVPVAQYALDSPSRPLILHYSGTAANQNSANSIPLGTLNGVVYTLQCWFSSSTNKLTEELDNSSATAFDVHEAPTAQNDSLAIGAPQFLNATNFGAAQLWTNIVSGGGHQEQLHMPLTIDLHSSPEHVQQGHIYMRATTIGFNSATAHTCDIEGEMVPAS
jgi:hypothetical protein